MVDKNCSMLVSPPNVPKNWSVEKIYPEPRSIMVDSGAFKYIDDVGVLGISQKEAFQSQLRVLGNHRPGILCHLDFPIPRKSNLSVEEKQSRVEITIENAKIFHDLFLDNFDEADGVLPLGVIQGWNDQSVEYCARELKSIGFSLFGVGSVARLSRINRKEIVRRVVRISKIVQPLHLFGVTSIQLMKVFGTLSGVNSLDSSTPIKEAIYSGIMYSDPLRRYKIGTPHFKRVWKRRYGYAKILNKPLPCLCFVCKNFGKEMLLKRGKKIYNNLRALHNYYHLKRELNRVVSNTQ